MNKKIFNAIIVSICSIFLITIVATSALLYSDYKIGVTAAETRFEKLFSQTENAIVKTSYPNSAFIKSFNTAIGSLDYYSSVTLQSSNKTVYDFTEKNPSLSKFFTITKSRRLTQGDKIDLTLTASIYTLSPAIIYSRIQLAFVIIIATTILSALALIYLYLTESKSEQNDRDDDNDDFSNDSSIDDFDNTNFDDDNFDEKFNNENVEIENTKNDDLDKIDFDENLTENSNDSNFAIPDFENNSNENSNTEIFDEQNNTEENFSFDDNLDLNFDFPNEENLDTENLENINEDNFKSEDLNSNDLDSVNYSNNDFENNTEEKSEEINFSEDTQQEENNFETDFDFPVEENLDNNFSSEINFDKNEEQATTENSTNDFSEINLQEENEIQNENNSANFVNVKTGLCFEKYLVPRLESELTKASSAELDLSLLLISLPNIKLTDSCGIDISKQLIDLFNFNEMLFEHGENGIACILSNSNIDSALETAESIYTELASILEKYQIKDRPFIGISSRTLRFISGERLITEAEHALIHAKEDVENPIIAFRVNPEKYRQYVSQTQNN